MTGFNDYYHQSQPTSNLHQQDNDSGASILFRIIYIYIYIHIKPTSTITYYIMLPIYERTNNEYEQKNEKKRVFRLFERSTTIQLQAGDHLPLFNILFLSIQFVVYVMLKFTVIIRHPIAIEGGERQCPHRINTDEEGRDNLISGKSINIIRRFVCLSLYESVGLCSESNQTTVSSLS